ncbi:hypothetical protein HK098_006116 [Nowakowskiella sp. JEL0407]|nr:hypothetical protein HK098_006116 [Nowakowskiella sp. JEL0407]
MSRSYENLAASKLPPHKKYSYSHSDLSTLNNSNYDYDFPSSSRPSSHRVSRFAEFRYISGGLSQESSKLPFYGTASEERGYRKKRSKSKARSPYMVQNNRLSASDNSDEEEFYRRRLPEKRYEFDGQLSSSSTEKKKPGSIRSSKKPIKSSLKKPSYSSATPRTSDDSDVSNSDYPTDNPRHSSHVVIAPLSFDESQKLYEMQQLRITEMFEGREERVRESLKRQEKWLIFREWIAGVLDLIFGVGDNKEFLRGEQIVGSGLPNPVDVFLIYRIIATIYTFIVLVSLISQEPSTNFVLDFGLWSWIILFVYFVVCLPKV